MSETKSLKRVDPFKIIRVKEGQDVYEFAVSDKMAIDYLRMMMKERIRANELARIKAEKGDNAQLEHDPLANKLLTFVWRGRPLKDTVHDVVAGETIMLFITKALKKVELIGQCVMASSPALVDGSNFTFKTGGMGSHSYRVKQCLECS
eukprot:1348332-Amorphochlora_amoeboformis.AAC.1